MVKALQTDEEVAAVAFAARPGFDVLVDGDPTALVEMANAEVGAVGILEDLGQAVAEVVVDVVEDAGHRGYCSSFGGKGSWAERFVTDVVSGYTGNNCHTGTAILPAE
ncbi:MAG: hypothetical protein OXO50_17030 [Caldilineaceae bacterium]|nr:hypothetical protein [Caldilineaceae bacterium]